MATNLNAKSTELSLTKENCLKVQGYSDGFDNGVTDELKTADFKFLGAEWGNGYGHCNMTTQAKGRIYDCAVTRLLSSDGGKTAFAATTIGVSCTKR
jgi:hypothetical protein